MSSAMQAPGKKRSVFVTILVVLFKILCTLFMLVTPLLGVWLASSLAAFLNGPIWAACLIGLALFPILPVLWDLLASWRARRKRARRAAEGKPAGEPFLRWWDRLILRTVFLNFLFIAVLLALYPQKGFTALSTRGDWMLAGSTESWAETTRKTLFKIAGSLEWLYEATREDPFRKFAEKQDDLPTPKPNEFADETSELDQDGKGKDDGSKPDDGQAKPGDKDQAKPDADKEAPDIANKPWPLAAKLHPAVRDMPASVETSIESVAKYLAEKEPHPFLRIKALHDYVADRIAYDAPALAAGKIPPQNAEKVFKERKGVCAGYARLMVALGKAINEHIVYVVGVSRDLGGDVGGGGHAWNAVEVWGKWYLIDTTWDAGTVKGDKFTKEYRTDYLFTPPAVFGYNHFPDKSDWQLRQKPLSRGQFMRQPVLAPAFFIDGFDLVEPQRSQITVGNEVVVRVTNPRGMFLLANLLPKGSTPGTKGVRCKVRHGTEERAQCAIAGPGTYQVWLFSNEQQHGSFDFVGQIEVNSR